MRMLGRLPGNLRQLNCKVINFVLDLPKKLEDIYGTKINEFINLNRDVLSKRVWFTRKQPEYIADG